MKKYICYCCLRKTSNFVFNKTNSKKSKYCKDCYSNYSAQERKIIERKNIIKIISEMKI